MAHEAHAEIRIAAPAEAVFPWLLEPERVGRWVGGTIECRALTDAPPGDGARMRHVVEQGGRRVEIDAEVESSTPPKRLVVLQKSPGLFDMTMTHDLTEVGDETLLAVTLSAELRSRMARLAAPLIARQVKSKLEEDLVRLKQMVEDSP
jgi:uncharacterized protein YndB with AHSA1/START domain